MHWNALPEPIVPKIRGGCPYGHQSIDFSRTVTISFS
jgi:hypothetical protein